MTARHRLIKNLESCTTAIAQQAQDRALDYIRDIDEYLPVRRETIGAIPALIILEFQLNLPDRFFEDPVIRRLNNACVDLIILSNVNLLVSLVYNSFLFSSRTYILIM